jgi:hypothetical protein
MNYISCSILRGSLLYLWDKRLSEPWNKSVHVGEKMFLPEIKSTSLVVQFISYSL